LALTLLIVTAIVDKVFYLLIPGFLIPDTFIPWVRAGVHLLMNLIIVLITVQVLKRHRIKGVRVVGQPRPLAVAPEPPASVIS
jgi:hypothetical protein